MIKERRVGRFDIRNNAIHTYPNQTIKTLAGMLIVEATSKFERDAIEYTAYSEHFDAIEDGELAPFYNLIVDKMGNVLEAHRE